MAMPKLINELPTASLGAGDLLAAKVAGVTSQVTITQLITEAATFTQSGTGAVARTVQDKHRERLSAFDFMTSAQIADVQAGTLAVDVTAAVAAWLLEAATKKKIAYAPAGKYSLTAFAIDNSVATYHGLIVQGESSCINGSGTEFVFASTGATAGLVMLSAASSSSSFLDRVVIRDCTFKYSSSSFTGTLVRLRRVFDIAFENVYFDGANGSAVLVDGTEWVGVSFRRCYLRDSQVGVKTVAIGGYTTFANVVEFDNCFFDDLTTASDFSVAGRTVLFKHCTTEPAEDDSASTHIGGAHDTTHSECWCGDADGTGTWISSTGDRLNVRGCDLTSSAIAIDFDTSFGGLIDGNKIDAETIGIRVKPTQKGVVRNNRIILTANSGIGIDVTEGTFHVLEDNDIVESGTPSSTVAYRLGAGTSGFLRDRDTAGADTMITNNATAGAWTISTNSYREVTVIDANQTRDPAEIAAGAVGTFDITVTGAEVGDAAIVVPPIGLDTGLVFCAFVTATNTVTVRIINGTAGAIDPASETWRCRVVKQTA